MNPSHGPKVQPTSSPRPACWEPCWSRVLLARQSGVGLAGIQWTVPPFFSVVIRSFISIEQ